MRPRTLFMVGAGLVMAAAAFAAPLEQRLRAASTGGGITLNVQLEEPLLAASDPSTHIRVEAIMPSAGERLPVVLALALDVSGSMAGSKLDNARLAAHALVDAMQPGDRIAIVPFANDAEVRGRTTATDSQATLHAAIDQLGALGGTCISCGLAAAFEVAAHAPTRGERRVLLLSDGMATEDLAGDALVAWARHQRGDVTLTSIGLGAGFDEHTMSSLARAGEGAFYFVHHSSVIDSVLERELAGLASTFATNGELRVRIRGDGSFVPDSRYALDPARRIATIELGSLRGGERRAFVMPLMNVAGAPTIEAGLVATLPSGSSVAVASEATIQRTDDLAEALAARDLDVVLEAERLRSAGSIDAAVDRFMNGESEGGVAALRDEAARLDALADDTGVAAFADEAQEVEQIVASLDGRDRSDRVAVGNCRLEQARAEELRGGVADPYHARGLYDLAVIE